MDRQYASYGTPGSTHRSSPSEDSSSSGESHSSTLQSRGLPNEFYVQPIRNTPEQSNCMEIAVTDEAESKSINGKEMEDTTRNGSSTETHNVSATTQPAHDDDATSTRSHMSEMQIPACLRFDRTTIFALKHAVSCPPVTKSILCELDLAWIVHNINLRCDVNFNHDLHFMPIKGERGEQKRRDALDYWLALGAEFQIYQHISQQCEDCDRGLPQLRENFLPRLPHMFEDLMELMEALVPDRDHELIAQNLDTPLLMQQLLNGVLDIAGLSRWLASLVKSHCAPMRDEQAERWCERIGIGARSGDMELLVQGLNDMFSFLETMKLDVANHQIRTYRNVLVEETVSFQRSYFRKRIEDQKLDLVPSQNWYQDAAYHLRTVPCDEATQTATDFACFVYGLCTLCASSCRETEAPTTLHYDSVRLQQIRGEVQDLVHLRICLSVFDRVVRRLTGWQRTPPMLRSTLQLRLLAITDNTASLTVQDIWHKHREPVAMEIVRAAQVACGNAEWPIADQDFKATVDWLKTEFADKYRHYESQMIDEICQSTLENASAFESMSALAISEAQKHWQQSRIPGTHFRVPPNLEDMSRRLAHMAVIHWRIWADLVYLNDDTAVLNTAAAAVE